MRLFLTLSATMALLLVGWQADGQHEGHGDHAEASETQHSDAEHVPQMDPMTGKVTMEGEIVDITCYLRHAASGEQHVKCALFCADQGMPFGFLEKESKTIYLLLPGEHESPLKGLREHIGSPVKITGDLTHGRGLTGLQIEEVETL
ncbi:MAG: hypothetical protein HN712_19605 [Gemmatimonadetes bacterium]|jgi:hypothetical protein|nr:hypothetical protein [Gemmatimonadota bacterium]MBT6150207.1 hypothetical protein [Gemmatimonadota bacterium]MBT7862530.1 hypothetical protein [Gemmatimonadota bacterium]